MPFDGSGNFSRLYSWQSDRDNGIRILASKMDGEFDNFAGAMNAVFFRNGLIPMSGNINMGQNSITGLAAGSVGAVPLRFADDPSAGMYLEGIGRLGFAAGGGKALEINNNNVTAVKSLRAQSQQITGTSFDGWTGSGMELSYSPTENVSIVGSYNRSTSGLLPLQTRSSRFGAVVNGVERLVLTDALGTLNTPTQVNGTLNTTGAMTQGGNQVWHAGNLNPASYQTALGYTPANRAGDTFTGFVSINSPDLYGLRVAQNGNGNGYIQYGQHPAPANNFHLGTGGDGLFRVYQGNYGSGIERLQVGGTSFAYNGNAVWHAGNINPAPKASPAFTGDMSIDGTGKFVSAPFPTSYLQLNDGVQGIVIGTGGGIKINTATAVALQGALNTTGNVAVGGNASVAGTFAAGATTINGTLNTTGALTQQGYQVWHAGNFTPGAGTPTDSQLNGLTRMNPSVDALGLRIAQNGTGNGFMQFGNATAPQNNYHVGTPGDGSLRFYSGNYGSGTERFRIENTGDVVAQVSVYAGNAMYIAGNAVWHAGNFNPNNYVSNTGQAADSAKLAGILPNSANAVQVGTPWVPVVKTDGVVEVGHIIDFHVPGAPPSDFDYRLSIISGTLNAGGAFNATGAITQNGQQVYHTGNLNPAAYAARSGAAFTGDVTAPRFANTGFLGSTQTNARNHFQQYNGGSATVAQGWIAAAFGDATGARAVIGQYEGVAVIGAHDANLAGWADLHINRGGGSVYMPTAYKYGFGMMTYQTQPGLSGGMSRGTSAPSGGSDGDMYFQYS